MRLIDADHLKKWMLARWQERNPQTDRPFKAIEILDQIDREMTFEEPHWIPCSSGEMPDYGVPVLITVKEEYTTRRPNVFLASREKRSRFVDEHWCTEELRRFSYERVTAWRPCEPWRGDAE